MKYWINTISLDHVTRGVAGGFTQAGHGKANGLKRLSKDDWIVFYSPRTSYSEGEVLQAFTAIGRVSDDASYRFEMSPTFIPWRRNVTFLESKQALIKPMLNDLSFIVDKQHWGYKFRLGLFEIPEDDFNVIKQSMQ